MRDIIHTVGFYLHIGGLFGLSMWTYLRILVVLMIPEMMKTMFSRELPILISRRHDND